MLIRYVPQFGWIKVEEIILHLVKSLKPFIGETLTIFPTGVRQSLILSCVWSWGFNIGSEFSSIVTIHKSVDLSFVHQWYHILASWMKLFEGFSEIYEVVENYVFLMFDLSFTFKTLDRLDAMGNFENSFFNFIAQAPCALFGTLEVFHKLIFFERSLFINQLVIDYFLRKRPIFKLNQKVDDEEKNVDD